jgi:hypothetical protein
VFRATGITAYLEAGGIRESAQAVTAHESPRATKLYDRTGDEITPDGRCKQLANWSGSLCRRTDEPLPN